MQSPIATCGVFPEERTKEFQRKSFFQKLSSFNRDRDVGHQINVLNNLNLEKRQTKSKSNLSNAEQKELSKYRNDKDIVIKPAYKWEVW